MTEIAQLRVVIQGVDQNLSSVLDRVERQIATTASAAGKAEQVFRNMVGAFGVQQLVQGGVELAQLGGQALTTSTRFEQLASAAGQSGDAILAALRKASGGEISDLNLQLTANRANLLEVATTADQFSTLMAIARDRAQQLGGSTTQAFDDLVTGLGRGSAEILDNLGIMVRVEEVNSRYAASLGKTVSALSSAEKKQALINAVLEQGRSSLAATGGAVEGPASAFERLGVAAENAKTRIAELIAKGAEAPAGFLSWALQGASDGVEKFSQLGTQQQQLTTRLVAGAKTYEEYRSATDRTNADIAKQTTITEFLAAKLPTLTQNQFALSQAMVQGGTATQAAVVGVQQYADVIAQLSPQQQALAAGLLAQGQGIAQVIAAITPLGSALGEISRAQAEVQFTGQASEAAAAALAARMTALATVGGPVTATVEAIATGLANHTISAEAAGVALAQLEQAQRLQASATQQEVAEQIRLSRGMQDATVAIDAQTQAIGEQLVKETAAADQAQRLADIKKDIVGIAGQVAGGYLNMADAAAQLAAKLGIAADEAARLIGAQAGKIVQQKFADQRSAREQLLSGGGPQQASASAQAFVAARQKAAAEAQAERERLNRGGGRGSGGGGGTGGGSAATALNAQRTLSNQTEDLEQKHQDKLIQIEADAMQKRMQAEQAFHQSQTRGRIGFYAGLANVTDAAQQKALAARYESIQAEANAIKQSQGADVAQAYAAAAEKALQQQSQIEQQIADAKKGKDPAKAEFLTGILAMQQASDAEELAAIKTKGSAIQAERDKQYANEESDFVAHLDRMGTAYERKVATLPGLKTALGSGGGLPSPASVAQAQAGGSASPTRAAQAVPPATAPADSGGFGPKPNQVHIVEDIATPPAIDALGSLINGLLSGVRDDLKTLNQRIADVDRSVRDLKRSGTFEGM